MPLFRAESQQAREAAWLGRIVLARPVSFTVLTISAVAMTIAIGSFLAFTEYTRKARVTGTLAPVEGVVRVIAQQAGRVEGVAVREGEAVQRGEALLSIGDARMGLALDDAGAAISHRLAQRHEALGQQREHVAAAMRTEQAGYLQRQSAVARELEQVDRELEAHQRRAALAQQALDRAEQLAGIGFLSPAARDRDTEAALEAQSRLEAMRRSRLGFARELAAVGFEAEAARSRARAQLAAIDMQRAAVDQERIERELQLRSAIVAPASGVVATILVDPGQTVAAGATLATIIPEGARLEAQLFSPSRSIGFVRTGQPVLLRYLAYPHQKFGSHGARITMVSRNPLSPVELGFTPIDGAREPLYRIRATLDAQTVLAYGKPEPLQAGMQVEADILLDRRRLIEWVFEPLLSLAGRA